MRGLFLTFVALSLAIGIACAVPQAVFGAAPLPAETPEEKTLSEQRIATDGPGLLAYLRTRLAPANEARVRSLVEQLGDVTYSERVAAEEQLLTLGDRARKLLIAARRNKDAEIRARADYVLRRLKSDNPGLAQLATAIRVVGWRQPPGAAELLLECLPGVEGELLEGTIRTALIDLAVRHGKADPSLVKALTSDQVWKRQVAVTTLCEAGASDQLGALRKSLTDADRGVRLAAALGLVRGKLADRTAVATLISFMDQPPAGDIAQAEDILFRLAGDKSPSLADTDAATRVKYREAWEKWWKEAGATTHLATLHAEVRIQGYTLVVLLDENQILSVDSSGKTRWKFTGIDQPLDIQPLPGDRVLIAEHNGGRITERNRRGEVVWEKKVTGPLVAQRLPNGNTFVATKDSLSEYDRVGKVVASYPIPVGQQVMRARKLPNGQILLVTQLGTTRFYRLDRFGKELTSAPVEVATSGGRLDVTPEGEVLIPEMNNDRVVVLDRDGKMVRQIRVSQPISALSLSGGGILVTSMSQLRAIEMDKVGKEVWEFKRTTRVSRAVRY